MAFPSADIDAAKRDASTGRPMHARDGANERGLACSVRPNDGDDGCLLDLERHVVEGLRVAVEDIEIIDAQHQSTASAPR